MVDLILATIGLLVFALPMAWMAWRIRQEFGTSPFFRQTRIGRGGKHFTILKFRTMSENAQVPAFCHRLRVSALDELPQLIHILQGEMSFVGPRPLIPEELQELHRMNGGMRRLSIRPGLTGLAQLHSAKVPSLKDRLRWDLEYVDRVSLGLDAKLIWKSVWVSRRGGWDAPGPKWSNSAGDAP